MNRYADIIDHPHHVSQKHPPLPPESRAAQFSPFAALTGYDDAVVETARRTDQRIDLSPDEVERIDAVLQSLQRGDRIKAVHFVPDGRKAGGSYRETRGAVKKLDPIGGLLLLADDSTIAFGDILTIEEETAGSEI